MSYTKSVQILQSSSDPVWQASALEGLATIVVIDSWSTGQGLQQSTAAARELWVPVADKLTQATALYHKPVSFENEQVYSLLTYLFCSCVLRHTSLLYAIWSAKGWGPLAFTAMLHPGPKPYLPPTLTHDRNNDKDALERLSYTSGVSRASIASVLAQAHGPWLMHLGPRERIAILEAMASMYSSIGYKRKEAFILREVLGCLLDLIVCGREEDGMSQPTALPSGLGIHNMTPAPTSNFATVGIRLSESPRGNESILAVLKQACRVMGLDLDAVQLLDPDESRPPVTDAILFKQYDEEETAIFQEPCGWAELQVGIVREAVAVAEALPDALKVALRRGDRRSVEYWSGRPVIDIALTPLPSIRVPIEKSKGVLQSQGSAVPLILQGGTDPFLYNPRRAQAGKGPALVVQHEPLEFFVTLQNPYVFEIELEELSLSTSGVAFTTQPIRYIIPPQSTCEIVLSGTPEETGTLVVRGCIVRAPGGVSKEYILPLHTDQEEDRLMKKRQSLACEFGRYKYPGLDCYPWEKEQRRQSRQITDRSSSSSGSSSTTAISTFKFLECKVVPEQPLLRIRRTTITHGALMLYDGERSSIRLTIENISTHPVDFLRLAFDDSTVAPAQQLLQEGNLSVFETYETEHSLINSPVFSWDSSEAKTIAPNQNLTLNVDCFGKVGCVQGTIHLSYSYIEREESKSSDVFYVRQLSYPLSVTVYHMLECHEMDVLPFPSYVDNEDFQKRLKAGKKKEVRNAYGLPFDVTFSRMEDGKAVASTTTTIPPGSMSRIVLPIKKMILPESVTSQPIPTLSDRQFVVTKSGLTDVEQKLQRELFWYREELFKCVRGQWQETGGIRKGELSLRSQRMTLHMLETLRLEAARVQLSLVSATGDEPITKSGGKYEPTANEFISLCVKVQNISDSPTVYVMDLEIVPSESIIHEGILNDIPVDRLDVGETREFTIGVCFLSRGHFEISAQVRPFNVPHLEARTTRSTLMAVVT
ncbi:hypothetical protein CC1G_12021 [Coprinopsis cinerea okayama7|uniref:Hypercellular protein HypA n=1 Tax=Coprinopsis cinerea (strain Okayama-7 / 130 / ATCC MYA-4618 / FGSC 9003) TaxID=240176 RepID=A8NF28_COPC7|nr:hypothetical protein CC1G_12021 [Coprinopsis cinerea okayama7\|eukprot:XP_001833196.2 hypothetical protein CC1G_12021 [Coprinopsis cinerea okayama7\